MMFMSFADLMMRVLGEYLGNMKDLQSPLLKTPEKDFQTPHPRLPPGRFQGHFRFY